MRIFVFYNFARLARVVLVFTGLHRGSGGWSWSKCWIEMIVNYEDLLNRCSIGQVMVIIYIHWTQSMHSTQNTGPWKVLSETGHLTQHTGHRTTGIGHRAKDTGNRFLDSGHGTLDTEHWILDKGEDFSELMIALILTYLGWAFLFLKKGIIWIQLVADRKFRFLSRSKDFYAILACRTHLTRYWQ